PDGIVKLGWRQGAILGESVASAAREHAPNRLEVVAADWLVVTSHDCDIVNESLEKEPVVEILRAVPTMVADKGQLAGRNPRTLHLDVDTGDGKGVLVCNVHERWYIPRELLLSERPVHFLNDRQRRLIAEWLAKRYIRSGFPTAFDAR